MAKSNKAQEQAVENREVKETPVVQKNNNKQQTSSPSTQQAAKQQTSGPINKEAKKELQKHQRLFQQLEEQIASLQKKKLELEAALASPEIYSDKQKFTQAESNYKNTSDELLRLNKQYELTFEKIMELESSAN